MSDVTLVTLPFLLITKVYLVYLTVLNTLFVFRWVSSGMLRRVVGANRMNVLEVLTAFILITLTTEAVSTSETSVNICQTTCLNSLFLSNFIIQNFVCISYLSMPSTWPSNLIIHDFIISIFFGDYKLWIFSASFVSNRLHLFRQRDFSCNIPCNFETKN
jgi:hypothetical protein